MGQSHPGKIEGLTNESPDECDNLDAWSVDPDYGRKL